MTTTKNNEHKKLNFPNEQEQSQACLNSAEHEKNQGRKVLNVPNKREQNQTCSDSAEREGLSPKGNVPNLRFPEFEGEWEKMRLDAFTERVMRKNKSNQSRLPLTISAQYGLVDQITFFNKVVASTDLSNYYLLKKGEFAYNKSYSSDYPWGAIKRLDNYDQGALSSLYICFAPQDNVVSDFILQYFESPKWHKGISEIAVEGARNHGLLNVAVQDFFHTYHYVPKDKKEQIKISKLLMFLDERIATQSKIIDKLQSLIKGIGKQLFMDNQNWRTVKIGELLRIGNGKDYKHLSIGKIPVYGTGGQMLLVNDYLYDGESVCIGRKGTIDTPMFLKGKFWTVDTLFYTYDFKDVLPKFCYYLFLQINWKLYNEGTGVPSLSKSTIENIKVKIPSLEQQHKICSILDCYEHKTNNEEQILELYHSEKQYLLRQMFI